MADDHKVVHIRGGYIPEPGKPMENVVEALEEMLEQARSGEVVGFVAAMYHADKTNSYRIVGCRTSYGTLGALETAKNQLAQEILEAFDD